MQLIVAPDRFRGAEIKVTGFWVPDGSQPDGVLFFDKESALHSIAANAVHVRFGECRYVDGTPRRVSPEEGRAVEPGYAAVGGVFEPTLANDAWPYAGEICSVWSIKGKPSSYPQNMAKELSRLRADGGPL